MELFCVLRHFPGLCSDLRDLSEEVLGYVAGQMGMVGVFVISGISMACCPA